MTDHGPDLQDDEEVRLRRCPVLYGPSAPLFGRDGDLERLRERLAARRFVVVKPENAGFGATRLAAEVAHASKADYPGGAVWIRHHGSSPKEAAADVVEALGLPTTSWLHWPFVATDHARATMWRGLASRPATLVVVDGWPTWAAPEDWTAPDGAAHVLAIADASTSLEVDDSAVFAVRRLARATVEAAVRQVVHDGHRAIVRKICDAVDGDALLLDVALARLRDADAARLEAYLARLEGRDGIIVEAFEALAPDARTLLMAFACLSPGPLPMSVVRPLWAAVAPHAGEVDLTRALDAIVAHGLSTRTVLDEPSTHHRTLAIVRDQNGTWDLVYTAVAAVLVDRLDALEPAQVHKARRIAIHARFAADRLESAASRSAYEPLLAAIARCPRPVEASDAARRHVALVRTIEDPPGPRTLDALCAFGCALTELRELPEAQTVLREAVALAERVHGLDSLEVAETLDLLERAIALGTCGQPPPEVLDLTLRAIAIRERAWGKDDPRLVGSLWSAGLMLTSATRYHEAVELLERVATLAERHDARRLPHWLGSKAIALGQLGRIDEALAAVDRALALQRANDPRAFVVALVWCAEEFLRPASRLDALLARVDEVLAWPELRSDTDADDGAQTIAKLREVRARTLHALGRRREASQAAAAAMRTFEVLFGANDPRVATLRELIDRGDAR